MKRILKVLLSTAVALFILIGASSADEMYVLCRPNDYVNVREFPSTKGAQAGRLECGDSIDTDGITKKDKQGRTWVQVYGGFEGDAWICAMYLQDSPVVVCKCTGYVSSKGRVALRRSPNGKRIKWLKNGTELSILAMSDDWVLTTTGYVKREYLDVMY